MTQIISILHRWTSVVLWSGLAENRGDAAKKALAEKVPLTGADLTGADLTGADLTRADLTGADLTDADLTDAVLTRADLTGADLTRADLTRADLTRAVLTDADLTDAVLPLTIIRDDVHAILDAAPLEVPALVSHLLAGKIDGSTYNVQGCACLVGTLAQARGVSIDDIEGITPDASRPAERFVSRIRPGHTPGNSTDAAVFYGWILEWQLARALAPSTEVLR